jgi:hypothetical protein
MHRSKRQLYSITSSAIPSKFAGMVSPPPEPLNDDCRDHPDTSAQKIRHPCNVRVLSPSRD